MPAAAVALDRSLGVAIDPAALHQGLAFSRRSSFFAHQPLRLGLLTSASAVVVTAGAGCGTGAAAARRH